ncbi:MAG: hypothetical protein U0797_04305 [Gemmataceae bacterium]
MAAITLAARPADQMREGLLLSLVKQLHSAHQKVTSLRGWATVIWPAAAGFFFGMVVTAEGSGPAPGQEPPIGLTFLFAGLGWYVRYWRQGNADLEVTETVRTLMAEFPGVVHDWGGEAVLRNPEMVGQLAQKLGVVEPPPVAEAPQPSLTGAERKAVAGRLARLGEVVGHAAGFGERKPLPWLLAGLIALAVAGGAGVGSAFAYLGYRAPLSFYGYADPDRKNYGDHYFSESGRVIDRAVYTREWRLAGATAALIGSSTGLAFALFSFLTLARKVAPAPAVPRGAGGGGAGQRPPAAPPAAHSPLLPPAYSDYVEGVEKYYENQGALTRWYGGGPQAADQYPADRRRPGGDRAVLRGDGDGGVGDGDLARGKARPRRPGSPPTSPPSPPSPARPRAEEPEPGGASAETRLGRPVRGSPPAPPSAGPSAPASRPRPAARRRAGPPCRSSPSAAPTSYAAGAPKVPTAP